MLMSMKEYAEHVGVSYNTIYRMCCAGELPFITFGNRRRIEPDKAAAVLREAEKQRQKEKAAKLESKPTVRVRIRTKAELLKALAL